MYLQSFQKSDLFGCLNLLSRSDASCWSKVPCTCPSELGAPLLAIPFPVGSVQLAPFPSPFLDAKGDGSISSVMFWGSMMGKQAASMKSALNFQLNPYRNVILHGWRLFSAMSRSAMILASSWRLVIRMNLHGLWRALWIRVSLIKGIAFPQIRILSHDRNPPLIGIDWLLIYYSIVCIDL